MDDNLRENWVVVSVHCTVSAAVSLLALGPTPAVNFRSRSLIRVRFYSADLLSPSVVLDSVVPSHSGTESVTHQRPCLPYGTLMTESRGRGPPIAVRGAWLIVNASRISLS